MWPIKILVSFRFFLKLLMHLKWFQKVSAVMLFDTIHQALITHTGRKPIPRYPKNLSLYTLVYTYTITNWGNPAELDKLVW